MGFMSGFGPAFARSFELARERSHEKEQDLFRMKFADYTAKRDEYTKTKAAVAKRVRLAKSYAESKDPQIWPKIYEWLDAGMDEDTIQERLEGHFSVENGQPSVPAGPDQAAAANPAGADMNQQATSAIDTQMEEAGMGADPMAPTAQEAPVEEGVDPMAPVDPTAAPAEDNSLNLGGFDRGNTASRVDAQMSEVTGLSIAEINKIISSDPESEALMGMPGKKITWTPGPGKDPAWEVNSIEEAVTNLRRAEASGDKTQIMNAQSVLDGQMAAISIEAAALARAKGEEYIPRHAAIIENGEFKGFAMNRGKSSAEPVWWDPLSDRTLRPDDVMPVSREAVEAEADIAKATYEETQAYTQSAQNLANYTLDAARLIKLTTENPNAVNKIGTAAQYLDAGIRNIKGTIDLLSNEAAGSDDGTKEAKFTWEGMQALSKNVEFLQEQARTFKGNAIAKTALDAYVADAIATRMAYAYGLSQGQAGRSVAITEFNNFKVNVLAGGDPAAIRESAAIFVMGQYEKLSQQEQFVNEAGTYARQYESRFGHPMTFKPAAPLRTLLGVNPRVLPLIDEFMWAKKEVDDRAVEEERIANEPAPGTIPGDPEGRVLEGTLQDGRKVYRLPDGRREVE